MDDAFGIKGALVYLRINVIFYSIFTIINKNTIAIIKHIAPLFSLFFLLNIAGPTLLLLQSNSEFSKVVVSTEQESDTKDIEDVNELVLNKTPLQSMNPRTRGQALLFVFCKKSFLDVYLECVSPPPDYI